MKLRIIVRETYCDAAANVAGAQAEIDYRTFEVEASDEFAAFWRSNKSDLGFRSIVGVEIVAAKSGAA